MNDFVAFRAPRGSPVRATTLHQHDLPGPDQRPKMRLTLRLVQRKQLGQARTLLFFVDIVAQGKGRRGWPRGVFEREYSSEFCPLYQTQGLLEILPTFAWEARDDIRGQGQPGHLATELLHPFLVLRDRVPPNHPPQYPVAAGLDRQVHVPSQYPEIGMRANEGSRQMSGMRTRVAQAFELGHSLRNLAEQGSELATVVGGLRGVSVLPPGLFIAGRDEDFVRVDVAIDRLPQKGHLGSTRANESRDLGNDLPRSPVPFRSAGSRNDAERATFVAPLHHRNVCARGLSAWLGMCSEKPRAVQVESGQNLGPALETSRPEQLGQVVNVVGAHHDIHRRNARRQPVAILLGHAAGHHHNQGRAAPL